MTYLLRREFLALMGAGLAVPSPGQAKAPPFAGASRLDGAPAGLSSRHLWIRQAGGGDELFARFRIASGAVDPTGLSALRWLFRDWRGGDAATHVDVRLFDLLARIQSSLSVIEDRPLCLTLNSGYRTKARNAALEGAAQLAARARACR